MDRIRLENVTKDFDGTQVIRDVSLAVEQGEFCVFVGPSGCGKSTLLRLIAGLEPVSSGRILIEDRDVTGLEPYDRGLSMVFQSYALYPHMTVRDNIAFALRTARMSENRITEKVAEAARMLQLQPLLNRRPAQLSGGQRQRVAIGRAIVREPKAFLFDEPLSNLDAALRGETRVEIATLHRALDATIVYVTHDQVEATTLADRIVVLNGGRVEQIGKPMNLYNFPANEFVATFLGAPAMNLIRGEIAAAHGADTIGIRPEHLELTSENGTWSGAVRHVEQLGSDTVVYLDAGPAGPLTLRATGQRDLSPGDSLNVTFDPAKLHLFVNGQRIGSQPPAGSLRRRAP